jgi:hypothetical protein
MSQFRLCSVRARRTKALVTRLMLGGTVPASTASSPTAVSAIDELAKLAHLREIGALTDERVHGAKARLFRS